MNAYRMKPLAFPWPPLIYGAAIAAAFLLQAYFPLAAMDTNVWIARAAGGAPAMPPGKLSAGSGTCSSTRYRSRAPGATRSCCIPVSTDSTCR